jgi:hypothetical protein
MIDESASFTEQDLNGFFREVRAYEDSRPFDGTTVVERLGRSLDRLEELVLFMDLLPAGGDAPPGWGVAREWGPREVLAHIVLMSQVLGWGMWAVGSGEQDEISLMSFLSLRDVSGQHFSRLQPAELLDMARTELTSSIEYLCLADADEMGRVGRVGSLELTAAEIGELLLCAHLEMHVDQLERSLQGARPATPPTRYAW